MFPENVQHYISYTHCYWLAGIEQISPGKLMNACIDGVDIIMVEMLTHSGRIG